MNTIKVETVTVGEAKFFIDSNRARKTLWLDCHLSRCPTAEDKAELQVIAERHEAKIKFCGNAILFRGVKSAHRHTLADALRPIGRRIVERSIAQS